MEEADGIWANMQKEIAQYFPNQEGFIGKHFS
jgi:hypothetical protein